MISLYFHIPFCTRKCPYCDFYSLPVADQLLGEYPDQLRRELELRSVDAGGEIVESVYFGGGTPSLLPPAAVAMLLNTVREDYRLAADAEITLEVNPGTVDIGTLEGLYSAGVNRLSIGAQSFDDLQLRTLGRSHDVARIGATIAAARMVGFDALSLDLIYALPGQSPDDLRQELAALLAFNVDHLSCYTLTVEPGTPFAARQQAGELESADDESARDAFVTVHETLTAAGYIHYEISNFARPGHACRHNQRYWQRTESYIGFGAGAHSFDARDWGRRLANPDDLAGYLMTMRAGGDPRVEVEVFDRAGALAERLYLGLRTRAGVTDAELRARFGVSLTTAFPQALTKCGERLQLNNGAWSFDLDGWLLFNHLISEFL